MRLLLSTAALLLALCPLAAGQSTSKSTRNARAEQELMQLERDWAAAFLRHDTAAVERILADEFVGIDGRGIMTDKTQEVEEAKGPQAGAPEPPFLILDDTVTDMKVRMYGDMAVVNGRSIEKIRRKNNSEGVIQYRRTTVWVKRGGRWQCVSFHGSRIMEPPNQ